MIPTRVSDVVGRILPATAYNAARDIYYAPRTLWRSLAKAFHPSEEAVLRYWIAQRDHAADVYFVQIGAHDGKTDDHLRPFVLQHGWKGVLVEPVPTLFGALRRNYRDTPGLTFINAAIADADGHRSFWRCRDDAPAPMTPLSSFRRDVIARHVRDVDAHFAEVLVPCLTVRSLLAQVSLPRLDLVMIDTEGYDYEILRQFLAPDLERWWPSLILYERRHLSREDRQAATELLRQRGYLLQPIGTGLNVAATRRSRRV